VQLSPIPRIYHPAFCGHDRELLWPANQRGPDRSTNVLKIQLRTELYNSNRCLLLFRGRANPAGSATIGHRDGHCESVRRNGACATTLASAAKMSSQEKARSRSSTAPAARSSRKGAAIVALSKSSFMAVVRSACADRRMNNGVIPGLKRP
jgi:hypothetical protein